MVMDAHAVLCGFTMLSTCSTAVYMYGRSSGTGERVAVHGVHSSAEHRVPKLQVQRGEMTRLRVLLPKQRSAARCHDMHRAHMNDKE
jgi:hypothetical protein